MSKPEIKPYERHVILCAGKKCDPEEKRKLMLYFKKRLASEGLDMKVRANRGGCLGVCEQGAIMVVYPEGVWYCNVNRANLDRIIEQHFKSGDVVEDLLFHQAELISLR